MQQIINLFLELFAGFGLTGIFILMAIESSVIPLPSEIVMIPAGYLVQQGKMNFWAVIFAGAFGSVFGALANYYFAKWVGRKFIKKFGKYFFLPAEKLVLIENYFKKHGSFSTFTGRLLPVMRHLISIPAGLAQMHLFKFVSYTFLGAFIWCFILTALGYALGQNQELITEYLHYITAGLILFLVVIAVVYFKWIPRFKSKS